MREEWRRAWALQRLIGYRLCKMSGAAKVQIADSYGVDWLMLLRAIQVRTGMAVSDPLRRPLDLRRALRWGPLPRLRRAA